MLPSEYKGQQEKCFQELDDAKPNGWPAIQEALTTICRRRGLSKTVVTAVIERAYQWTLEEDCVKNVEVMVPVLQFMAELTAGKIFVEVIRARILSRLADFKKEEGDVKGAKELLQDIQVEAFTTMDTREKTEFILKQMRLTLVTRDYVRVLLTSKKLSKKTLDLEELDDLKLSYYEMLIAYFMHSKSHFEASDCVKEIMSTKIVLNDPERLTKEFMGRGLLTILEQDEKAVESQKEMIAMFNDNKILRDDEPCKTLVDLMKSMHDSQLTIWSQTLPTMHYFIESYYINSSVFEGGDLRKKLLNDMVLKKNLKVISNCYKRITIGEIATLLNSTATDIEKLLVEMIANGNLSGKIDRPSMLIKFGDAKSLSPITALDNSGEKIAQALSLLNSVCHQIEREKMLVDQRAQ